MRALELRIPPPLVALAVALLMWLASRTVTPFALPLALRIGTAVGFVILGIGFALSGVVSFMRAKTTVNPTKPATTSSLVVTGVYRITRNPMYLGMAFVLLGWSVFLANPVAFFVAPLFVFYIDHFQIVPEERALHEKFGAELFMYKARVRRWL